MKIVTLKNLVLQFDSPEGVNDVSHSNVLLHKINEVLRHNFESQPQIMNSVEAKDISVEITDVE